MTQKKVLSPGFAAVLLIQEAKSSFQGMVQETAGPLVGEILMIRAHTRETEVLRCWPASFRWDFNQ